MDALRACCFTKSKLCHNLMDKNDPCFKLFGTCDSVAQQLPKEDVGGSVKHGPLSLQTNILDYCSCTVSYCQHTFLCV